MEIRVLRYFLTVAREENITKAAEKLHITQPTLSRQLRQLEEELGKTLLKRGNYNVKLTEDGMLLRKRAEEILDLVKKTETELAGDNEEITGDVYVGAGETDAVRIIARIVQKIRQAHPGIIFHNISGDSIDVIDKLNKGLIDFGVLFEPADISGFAHIKFPVYDTWGVLMRRDSDLAPQPYITADMLADRPLIVSRQREDLEGLSEWLGLPKERIRISATSNLIFNGSLLVDEGMGYAITLDKLINCSGESNLCFRPFYPLKPAQMYLVWKKYQVFSKAAERFLEDFKRETIQ
ncbi:LysR family transcriptional regulator [Ruminococcus champanellensis]|uniref:LysR family transcriptional regulator n=1 Tax=Ruminococcus champanellensis TaxID=1161942 RepID=UPI0023F52EDF|nr:LysR family transcriptional regulator [Ruminococcus champanellensis]